MTPRPRALERLLAATLLCAVAACSAEEPVDSRFPTPDRYISKLTPKGPEGRKWIPESERPPLQRRPWMLIWEVTHYPGAAPTAEQRSAADELARRSLESARRHGWFEYLKGIGDGYQPAVGDDTHYQNEEYILDDRVLDPERPEFLMYYTTPEGPKLTGFMFYVREPGDEGPQVGGPLTVWHYHMWTKAHCLRQGLIGTGVVDARGRCLAGKPAHRSPEMLHVWFVEHPEGRFGTAMQLPQKLIRDLRWD